VEPRWKDVRLDAVAFSDVQSWVRTMVAGGLSASRTRQSYHLLTGLLDAAVKDGLISVNRAAGVPLPKLAPSRRRYLTLSELEAFAAAAGPWRLFILTLGYTGLRWGEATELRVQDFDPLRARLNVVNAVSDVDGILVVGPAKDHERRSVPLPRSVAEELARTVTGRSPGALVFAAPRGGHMRNQAARRDWWDAATKATGQDGLTPHELRHTAASLAVQAGASVLAVSRMLGHAKPSMTLDVYADLFDTDLDDIAARLDEARSGSPRPRPKAKVTDLPKRAARR
jgi:integrase